MKIVERPQSTTVVLDAKFHLCRSTQEVANSLAGVDKDNIIVWGKIFDPVSFQPQLAVIVKHGDVPLAECMKFIIPLEYASGLLP